MFTLASQLKHQVTQELLCFVIFISFVYYNKSPLYFYPSQLQIATRQNISTYLLPQEPLETRSLKCCQTPPHAKTRCTHFQNHLQLLCSKILLCIGISILLINFRGGNNGPSILSLISIVHLVPCSFHPEALHGANTSNEGTAIPCQTSKIHS